MATQEDNIVKTSADIIDDYMEYVTSVEKEDRELTAFCERYDISENKVEEIFGSLFEIEKVIWKELLLAAISTTKQDPNYVQFSNEDRLLTFLYTFFENLTLNRDYISINLEDRKCIHEKVRLYSLAKDSYRAFLKDITSSSNPGIDGAIGKVIDIAKAGTYEGFWLQLLFLIDFWSKDVSEGFEKTDIAIEKSVRAAMDLVEAAPVKSMFDLGKFLWKERFGTI